MTAFTIPQGPLEREGQHAWNSVLTLNDLAAFPRYEITGPIVGFHGRPPVDDTADDNPGRIGATPRPGLWRARDVTYALTVIGQTLPELRAGQALLGAAFSDGRILGQMIISPAGDWTGPLWSFTAKPQALTAGAEQFDLHAAPAPWQMAYTLTLRMFDPRYYTGASGGLTPESVTLTAGTPAACQNQGSAPTDPTFVIPGPMTDATVTLTNVTTGKVVVLRHVTVASGDHLIVNFAARSITLQSDGTILRRFLDPLASTWWKAGVDGLPAVTTSSVKIDGAGAVVSWSHAHWG